MFRSLQSVEPRTAAEQAAFSKWLDQSDRPPDGPLRPHTWGRGRYPDAALDRPLSLGGNHLLLHAVLGGDRKSMLSAEATMMGGVDCDDHRDAAPALVPRQPVSHGRRRPAADRDGADAFEILDQQARIVGLHVRAEACDARSGIATRLTQRRTIRLLSLIDSPVEHGGEDRAEHERAGAQVNGKEEGEDRTRGAVKLGEVGRPGEVPAEPELHGLVPRAATAAPRRAARQPGRWWGR